MTAGDVKAALRTRHPAIYMNGPKPTGLWTCLEEWMNIDLLAVAAWASVRPFPRYARVGYEVKVSRSDYKRELARPFKRAAAVAFCHEFYFAVPLGLLKPDEIAWVPPWGFDTAGPPFERQRCPGAYGAYCLDGRLTFGVQRHTYKPVDRRNGHRLALYYERDAARRHYGRAYSGVCLTCRGQGWIAEAPAVRADAPPLWVPDDVGLVVIDATGKPHTAKKAPRRKPHGADRGDLTLARIVTRSGDGVNLSDAQLADLVRWVSCRPDPGHAPAREWGSPAPSGPLPPAEAPTGEEEPLATQTAS